MRNHLTDSLRDVLFLYTRALARINFIEAWISTREYAEDTREILLGEVLDAILSRKCLKYRVVCGS